MEPLILWYTDNHFLHFRKWISSLVLLCILEISIVLTFLNRFCQWSWPRNVQFSTLILLKEMHECFFQVLYRWITSVKEAHTPACPLSLSILPSSLAFSFSPSQWEEQEEMWHKNPYNFLIASNEIVKAAWQQTKQTRTRLYPCEPTKQFCAFQRHISAHTHKQPLSVLNI